MMTRFNTSTRRPAAGRGFSLIELLVVIAIIAIIAGLTFPIAATMRERGNQTACIGNLQSIGQALRLYRLDERTYPPALYGYLDESRVVDRSGTKNSALPPAEKQPTTFLYPHYARSRREFKCPNNPNRFDETTLAGPFTGQSLPRALPTEKVQSDDGYNLEAITSGPVFYYLFDSYDGGVVRPTMKVTGGPAPVLEPGSTAYPGYEQHFRRDWASLWSPTGDLGRELLNRNPEDGTFVTACSYHRTYRGDGTLAPGPRSMDMVLFLDGHTEKIPSSEVGPFTAPRL